MKGGHRLRRVVGVVAATVVGMLACLPSMAAAVPPPGINEPPLTGAITSFPQRDFVSAEGWDAYPSVDVEVLRPDPENPANLIRIGYAAGVTPDDAGMVEVNHPGGACWGETTPGDPDTRVTPDIRPGDRIRLTSRDGVGTVQMIDQTTTADVVITQFVSAISADTVELRGTAKAADGSPLPLDQLEVRLIGSSKDRFAYNGRRDLRAPRDGNLAIDAAGNWVATIPGLGVADMSRALAAENRVVWLGADPATGTEATIFEAGDGVAPGPQAPCTAPLQGAVASPNRTSIAFPATEILTDSAPETVRITNLGAGASPFSDLVVSSITITGAEAANFRVSNDACTADPRPLTQSCDIQLTFRPLSAGIKSAVVNITSNAGNTLVPVTATGLGTGVGEEIAFGLPTPATLGLGTRSVGSTSPAETVTIRNIGNIGWSVTGVTVTGAHAADFTVVPAAGTDCAGTTVNANDTCNLAVTFTPSAEGPRSATLVVSGNAADVVVPLSGAGLVTTGIIDPPPPPIALGVFAARDFVSVEGFEPGEPLTIQVIRHGVVVGTATDTVADEAGIAEVNHPGGDCWDVTTPNIRAGDVVRVTRADGRAYQTTTADVRITAHATETAPGSNIVVIKGYARDLVTGGPLPLEQLESRMIASSADPFSINDRRAVAAPGEGTLTYDTVDNPDGTRWTATYDFNGAPTPAHDTALAISEENRIMWLGRDPLALFEITFWEDGADVVDGPSAPCTAPGEAPSPGVAVSPSVHTYPQLTSSEQADRTFTVRNIGNAPLSISTVTFAGANPGDFQLQGGLPGSIAPGATGSFTVRFRPTGIGLRTATVQVVDNAVGSPHTALVTGTGVTTSTASALVTPTSLSFGDTQVGVDSAALAVTVTNEGGADLTFPVGPTVTGANAGDFRIDGTPATACVAGTTVLGTGETCTLSIIFNPSAVNGRSASLAIATNDLAQPTIQVPLTGVATTTAGGVFDPPRAPHVIEAFPVRDYVAGSGYAADEFVRIDVYRDGILVGRSQIMTPRDTDPTDTAFDGFVEVNHAGGVCWSGTNPLGPTFTPDIVPGDVVRAVRLNGVGTEIGADQIHVADLDVSSPAVAIAADTVVMTGSAIDPFTGNPLPAGSIEPRITSVAGPFEVSGRTDIRAGSGLQGTVTMVGARWVATFSGLSAADVALAVAGDSKVLWLGRAPLALTELTHWEFGEIPGPDPGCAGSPLLVSEPTFDTTTLSLGFGGLGAPTATLPVVFANPGPTTVTPVIAGIEGLHATDFAVAPTSTCGAALAPGQSCRIDVGFTASALGTRVAALKVRHDGANLESFLPLSGTGVGAPTITAVTPAVGHGGTVTVTGTQFTSTSSATIGGVAAAFTVVSDTVVELIVPAAAAPGTGVPVVVTTAGGSATTTIEVLPDPPTITTVTPTTGIVGTVVTVTGTNLAGATVTFNGVASPSTVNGAGTSLTTTVPVGATTGNLRVVTGGGAATAPFTVIPSPVVTGFTPATARTGTAITINGQNFVAGATVRFRTAGGGTVNAAATILSATQIRVTVPGTAVQGPVTVTTAGGAGSAVFTVERAPSNVTTAPASGPVGSTVTISGENLLTTSKVAFNGRNAASFVVVDQNTITAVVPAGATTGRVSVTNRWGSANSAANFTIITAPTITSFTPTIGVRGVTLVTVTGTGFASATAVALGQGATNVPVVGFTIVSATSIRFTIPATTPVGLYTVRVTNPAGTGSSVGVLSVS